jgi:Cu/Ag efflux protein CusF
LHPHLRPLLRHTAGGITVELIGYLKSAQDLNQIPLGSTVRGAPLLLLGNVADVVTGPQMRRSLVSLQAQAKMTMNREGHDMSQMEGMDMQATQERVMTKGVITRLDEASGKVGINHEAIENLKMPPMSMVFLLADPALTKGLKVGDAVSFRVENRAGKLTETQLQKLVTPATAKRQDLCAVLLSSFRPPDPAYPSPQADYPFG